MNKQEIYNIAFRKEMDDRRKKKSQKGVNWRWLGYETEVIIILIMNFSLNKNIINFLFWKKKKIEKFFFWEYRLTLMMSVCFLFIFFLVWNFLIKKIFSQKFIFIWFPQQKILKFFIAVLIKTKVSYHSCSFSHLDFRLSLCWYPEWIQNIFNWSA